MAPAKSTSGSLALAGALAPRCWPIVRLLRRSIWMMAIGVHADTPVQQFLPAVLAVPATMADGSAQDFGGEELITAIVAGYEVGVRMSMGRLSYAPSGAWSPYVVIGLPVAVQIAAKPFKEAVLFQVVDALEKANGFHNCSPVSA